MHEYGPVIITFLVVLAGILFNRKDVSDLEADMNRQFTDMKSDFNRQFDEVKAHLGRIDSDLRLFHGTDKELEGRINELSSSRRQ